MGLYKGFLTCQSTVTANSTQQTLACHIRLFHLNHRLHTHALSHAHTHLHLHLMSLKSSQKPLGGQRLFFIFRNDIDFSAFLLLSCLLNHLCAHSSTHGYLYSALCYYLLVWLWVIGTSRRSSMAAECGQICLKCMSVRGLVSLWPLEMVPLAGSVQVGRLNDGALISCVDLLLNPEELNPWPCPSQMEASWCLTTHGLYWSY